MGNRSGRRRATKVDGYIRWNGFLKVVMVGDSCTGKTCVYLRIAGEEFTKRYVPSVVVDFQKLLLELDDTPLTLQLWDTSGQERFRRITTSCYRGAHAFMICYDVSRLETFQNLPNWIELARKHGPPDAVLMLLGIKSDLEEEKVVDYETAKDFADENGVLLFEVSAKDGTNIELALLGLISIVRNQQHAICSYIGAVAVH